METAPDWVTLTDGEEVVWHGRPTIYSYVGEVAIGLVIIAVGIGIWVVIGMGNDLGIPTLSAVPSDLIGGVVVVLGITTAGRPLIRWWNVRYLITSEEVYKKRGVISRTVQNLRLDRVQNTSFTQSILGRLLSHGNVHVETAGTGRTEMTFRKVSDPEDVVGHITTQLDRQHS